MAFVPVPAKAARKAMREAGLADFAAELFLEMYEAMDAGRLIAEEPRVVRVAPALAARVA